MKSQTIPKIFFGGLLLILISSQILWLKKDTLPPAWDESHHLRTAVEYWETFRKGNFIELFTAQHYFNYPPLFHWTLAPALALFNRHPDAGGIVNFFYTLLLLLSVFSLVQFLVKENANRSDWLALIAVCLIAGCPYLIHIFRFPMMDGALTAWSAFTLLALVRSQNFSNRFWSVLLGIGWGCGMMTKFPFFSYLLFPTLWILTKSWSENRKNIALSAFAAFLIAMPWYYPNYIFVFLRAFWSAGAGAAEGDPSVFSIASFLWYPNQWKILIGPMGLFLFLAGLFWSIKEKKGGFLLFSAILLPTLFWTLTENKDMRYFLPILPALCIFATLWISRISPRLQIAIFTLCFAQFIYLNLLSPKFPPVQQDWKQKEILNAALAARGDLSPPYPKKPQEKEQKRFSILKTLCHPPYLEQISLRYATIQHQWFDRIKPQGSPPTKEFFMFTDFVLTQTAGWQENHRGYANHQEIKNSKWFAQVFSEIGRWNLPEPNGQAILYGRKVSPVGNFSPLQLEKIIAQTTLDPGIAFKKLRVKVEPSKEQETRLGKFRSITLWMEEAKFRGLPLGNVSLVAENIQLNLPLLKEKNELRILKLNRLTPNAKISAEIITEFSRSQLKKYFSDLSVKFENGRIIFSGRSLWKISAEVTVHLQLDEKENCLAQKFEKIKIGWFRIPRFFYKYFTDRKHFLGAGPGMPFDLNVRKLKIDAGLIEIN